MVPPKRVCSICGMEDLIEVPGGCSGTIYSFTTIYVAPTQLRDQAPYEIALVKLPQGVKVTARIERTPAEGIEIGMPVRFTKRDEQGLWFKVVQ